MQTTTPQGEQLAHSDSVESSSFVASSDFRRLVTLLRLAAGAWVLAEYEDATIRGSVIQNLRLALDPISLIEVSLIKQPRDPLAIVSDIPANVVDDAPVVSFTGLDDAFPQLAVSLDLQREALALLPHRLLFWVTPHQHERLAKDAPNFYSRISGVFHFIGRSIASGEVKTNSTSRSSDLSMPVRRNRPVLPFRNEKDRVRLIDYLLRRIADLRLVPSKDCVALGDSWYDLGGLYENAEVPQWNEAEVSYLKAAHSYAEVNMGLAEAESYYQAGFAGYRAYNTIAALDYLRRALLIYRLLDDGLAKDNSVASGEADVLLQIGQVQQFRDDYDSALISYERAFILYNVAGDELGKANTLHALGQVQQFRDDYDSALISYEQALVIYRDLDVRVGEANALRAIGNVHLFYGDYDSALSNYEQAQNLYHAIGDRLSETYSLRAIGDVQLRYDEYDDALSNYDNALALSRTLGDQLGEAHALRAIGDVQLLRAEYDAALSSYKHTLDLYRMVGDKLGEANTYSARARLAVILGSQNEAVELLESAYSIFRAMGDRYSMAVHTAKFGQALVEAGHTENARSYLEESANLFTELGMKDHVVQIQTLADSLK